MVRPALNKALPAKRPLAMFGVAFLCSMLLLVRLQGTGTWLLALCAAVLLGVGFFAPANAFAARHFGRVPFLLAGALLAALLLKGGYDLLRVRPVARLAGTQAVATAHVLDVEPGYSGDTIHATLRVTALDGKAVALPFQVTVRNTSGANVSDEVLVPLRFYAYTTQSQQLRGYTNAEYVAAVADGPLQNLGPKPSFSTNMRLLQYAASQNIRQRLPLRLSGIAAAMAVGDRRYVPDSATLAYRAAGLSHMMVVSGLHLSLLCLLVQRLLRYLCRSKRLVALGCIAFIVLFMFFTGFSPSIVRSGVVHLLVYIGTLLRRRADIYTSLGFAALLLVAANPYASADVGLLLSFTATLGALASSQTATLLRRRWRDTPATLARRVARRLLVAALTPAWVTLATLPVLVYAGISLTLLSIPMNVIAVPLLAPIVICGFLMAIPASLPLLGLLGLPASVVGGALLALLETLTSFCLALPWTQLPLGGLFGLTVVLLVYGLIFAGLRLRRVRAFACVAALVGVTALLLHLGLSRSTVQATVAGSGPGSSLVISKNGQSVVLYRGRQSASQVSSALFTTHAQDCVLFIDLRQSNEGTEYIGLFAPRQTVVAWQEVPVEAIYAPMEGVTVYLARQGEGMVACVDIDGYKLAVPSSRVDLSIYAPPDLVLAGGSPVAGEYGALLASGSVPAWAQGLPVTQVETGATVWIRPGRSVRIRDRI